jgi:cytochrome c oxidase subunit 1
VTSNDPLGYGRSLEWATSCPPPRHNFVSIPRIRSESPAFDLNHPEAEIHEPAVQPVYAMADGAVADGGVK